MFRKTEETTLSTERGGATGSASIKNLDLPFKGASTPNAYTAIPSATIPEDFSSFSISRSHSRISRPNLEDSHDFGDTASAAATAAGLHSHIVNIGSINIP